MKNIKLKILMGLPASGKTKFAEDEKKRNPLHIKVLDIDAVRDSEPWKKDKTISYCIHKGLRDIDIDNNDTVIVDGLFLTNEHLKTVITTIGKCFNKVEITIYRWREDRDTCLKNDGGRRETTSAGTILYSEYEQVDINWLNEQIKDYNCIIKKVVSKDVVLKEDWYRLFKNHVWIHKDEKMRSGKWVTSGVYGNCWNNSFSSISPDEPCDFDNFDELLGEICPNLTFLHYKKIRKECVSTEETYESEYYGGGTHYMNWVCDLPSLYEKLQELGYELNK